MSTDLAEAPGDSHTGHGQGASSWRHCTRDEAGMIGSIGTCFGTAQGSIQ